MKAGKIWGNTELVHANGVLEFHRIEYKKGGTCSKHLHEYKWNGFFVESGNNKCLRCPSANFIIFSSVASLTF